MIKAQVQNCVVSDNRVVLPSDHVVPEFDLGVDEN
jgi:hypothetical protein